MKKFPKYFKEEKYLLLLHFLIVMIKLYVNYFNLHYAAVIIFRGSGGGGDIQQQHKNSSVDGSFIILADFCYLCKPLKYFNLITQSNIFENETCIYSVISILKEKVNDKNRIK